MGQILAGATCSSLKLEQCSGIRLGELFGRCRQQRRFGHQRSRHAGRCGATAFSNGDTNRRHGQFAWSATAGKTYKCSIRPIWINPTGRIWPFSPPLIPPQRHPTPRIPTRNGFIESSGYNDGGDRYCWPVVAFLNSPGGKRVGKGQRKGHPLGRVSRGKTLLPSIFFIEIFLGRQSPFCRPHPIPSFRSHGFRAASAEAIGSPVHILDFL